MRNINFIAKKLDKILIIFEFFLSASMNRCKILVTLYDYGGLMCGGLKFSGLKSRVG